MGCLLGLFKLAFGLLWKAVLAAAVAVLLSQADDFFDRRGGSSQKAWRTYRKLKP